MTCQICLKRTACRAVPIKQLTYPRELTLYACMDCDKFVRDQRWTAPEQLNERKPPSVSPESFALLQETLNNQEKRIAQLEHLWTRRWEPDL